MKKYIFAIATILLLGGCQQVLNDFNQSLAQNLNSNKSEDIQIPNAENLDTELKKFEQERVDFFKKFLVAEDESLEAINSKYQNSSNLISNAKREYNNLKAKALKLSKAYPNYDFDFTISGYTNYLQFGMFSTRYNSYVPDELKNYINTDEYISVYNKELGDYLTTKYYQSYLKKSYDSYSDRAMIQKSQVKNSATKEQLEREDAIFQQYMEDKKKANEKKAEQVKQERAKVKGACDKWLEKAKKDVYSLGVGDYVVYMARNEASAPAQIRAVERNTFLLYAYVRGEFYGDKSDFIPEKSLKTAPSRYCYR